jgi:ligand-binding sensor domain-containing protein
MNKITALLIALFFFFLISEAAQPVNVAAIIGNSQTVTCQAHIANSIWVGTNNGLYIINANNQKSTHLTEQNSVLPSNKVSAIAVTADGNVFVATEKGIFRFDGYAYLVINNENSNLPETGITSLAVDKNDNLWVGTNNKGLVIMNNYKCRFFNTTNSALTNNHITAVKSDASGNVFAQLANNDVVKIGDKNMTVMSTSSKVENAVASAK